MSFNHLIHPMLIEMRITIIAKKSIRALIIKVSNDPIRFSRSDCPNSINDFRPLIFRNTMLKVEVIDEGTIAHKRFRETTICEALFTIHTKARCPSQIGNIHLETNVQST